MKKAYNGLYNRCVKRLFDIGISGIALVILWPFYLIIGIAIAVEDGFPIFYRAPRGGYKNRPFKICKFRSMVKNADKIGGGTTALHDSRITKVGNFLRKTKLDEIPQLVQVFLGKMSLIGPRPELLKYVKQYILPEKNKLRVKYAHTVSFSTDVKLLFLTLWKVIEKAYGFIVKKEHR